MNNKIRILILLSLFVFTVGAQAKENPKNFLWKVSSEKTTVYLLGSIHLMKEDVYPLPEVIENAYKSSDNLVVEVNVENVNPLKMLGKAMFTDSNNLEGSVSPEVYKKLSQSFEEHNVKKEVFNRYKPWFAVINLLGLELMSKGFSGDIGIDKHFIDEAKKVSKKILELESFEQQIELFENGMKNYESNFIDFSLSDFEQTSEQVDTLVEFWKKGDAEGFEKAAFEETSKRPEFDNIMKIMVDERNFKMADKIIGYLNTNEKYFIVVGGGHIVGRYGLLNLLKNNGFKIEQM